MEEAKFIENIFSDKAENSEGCLSFNLGHLEKTGNDFPIQVNTTAQIQNESKYNPLYSLTWFKVREIYRPN